LEVGRGLEVLVFELRASHLLGKFSTTWAMLLALFDSGYFSERVSFLPMPGLGHNPPTNASHIYRTTEVNYHTQIVY
jgi:hypothetical protein